MSGERLRKTQKWEAPLIDEANLSTSSTLCQEIKARLYTRTEKHPAVNPDFLLVVTDIQQISDTPTLNVETDV